MKALQIVLIVQGIYYCITALWALIDIRSFMRVTGPKKDVWLVKTVSLLILSIGLTFVFAGRCNAINLPILILAYASAAGFICAELYYVFRGTISSIYLLDAAWQVVFILFFSFGIQH